MKTTFVILVLFIAFFQAGSSEPTEITRRTSAALEECVNQLNLETDKVIAQSKLNVISEDNDHTIAFFACFSSELELLNEAGDADFEKLLPFVQDIIKQRLGDSEDADTKALRIATAAIEQCKSTPKAENPGLTALRIRNCIRSHSLKPETR